MVSQITSETESLFDALPIPAIVHTGEMVLRVNMALCEQFLGPNPPTPAEVANQPIAKFLTAESTEQLRAFFNNLLQYPERAGSLELQVQLKGQDPMPVTLTTRFILYLGQPALLTAPQPADQINRLRTELQASEFVFDQVFNINPAIKLIIDPATGKIVDANAAACDFYGYSYLQFTQLNISDINTLDEAAIAREMEQARTERRQFFKFQHRLANGEIRPVDVYSGPLQRGNQTYLFSIIIDAGFQQLGETETAAQLSIQNAFIRTLPDVLLLQNEHGQYLQFHAPPGTLLFNTVKPVIGATPDAIFPIDLAELLIGMQHVVKTTGQIQTGEYDFMLAGENRFFEIRMLPVPKSDWVMTILRDMTNQKQAEVQLQNTNDQLMLMDLVSNHLQLCHTNEDVFKVIEQYVPHLLPKVSGTLALYDEVSQQLVPRAGWGKNNAYFGNLAPNMCPALLLNQPVFGDNTVPESQKTCSHTCISKHFLCMPLSNRRNQTGILHLHAETELYLHDSRYLAVMLMERVSLTLQNIQLNRTLEYHSRHDALTDLYNRRYMEQALAEELTNIDQPLAVVIFDLDHFKHFNDTWGHAAGDALLSALGQLLKAAVRPNDIACRYGGEEFCLILPGASLATAHFRADQILNKIRGLEVVYEGNRLNQVTASMGVACLPEHGTTADALLNTADTALYAAKAAGRDRVLIAPLPNHAE